MQDENAQGVQGVHTHVKMWMCGREMPPACKAHLQQCWTFPDQALFGVARGHNALILPRPLECWSRVAQHAATLRTLRIARAAAKQHLERYVALSIFALKDEWIAPPLELTVCTELLLA